jgi:hypothetical protein
VGVTEPLYPYAPHGRGFEGTRPGVQFHAPVGGCGRVCIVWELWVLLLMIYGLHGMFPPLRGGDSGTLMFLRQEEERDNGDMGACETLCKVLET